MKRLAAVSGCRAPGKRHHHHELADLAALRVVRNRPILAGIPAPEKLLTGDAQQISGTTIEERPRISWGQKVSPWDWISNRLCDPPPEASQEGSRLTPPCLPKALLMPTIWVVPLNYIQVLGFEP